MKLLSIAIPCYNSQDYMRHAIETLLAGGEDVEILVVNDGSKDKTADIAAEYPGCTSRSSIRTTGWTKRA